MSSIKMYCLDLNNEDYDKIMSLGYTPVGLGENEFNVDWLRDNTGDNITHKNNSYGEYSFHYWFWKNKLEEIEEDTWIGFCAYRRFWSQNKTCNQINKKKDFLKTIPIEWNENSVILGQQLHMNGWTLMKILKHGLKSFVKNPKFIIKKNRNLKLHFDSFHGYGNLDRAIDLLDKNEKNDFKNFMLKNNSYNRGNMFICKSKKLIRNYYESLFPWLMQCEKLFGFKKKNIYGQDRIYAFLAERYLSYWFNKYAKVIIWPVHFYNINQNTPT